MKQSFIRYAILVSMLGASVSPALADEVQIPVLLKQGFEIRAAYATNNGYFIDQYLILQKGSTVYQCSTRDGQYSNGYKCVELSEWKPRS